MDQTLNLKISAENAGCRADSFLFEYIEDFTRNHIQKLIKDGNLKINGIVITKCGYSLKENDIIDFYIPEPTDINIYPQDIPLDILYEDDDIIIVNKPKGMVVHPAAGHYEDTLVNALLYHCKGSLSGINGILRPGIVHRIDKDTSGSLLVCKNDFAHNIVANDLKEHNITRIYKAIVHGTFKEIEGTVDAPIGRSKNDRKKMAIESNGKRAVTHYKVIETYKEYSFMEFKLETGRTHQIRVHMASINHPLLGDEVYGRKNDPFNTSGQALHAEVLGLKHPRSNKYIEVSAPIPQYMTDILNKLSKTEA